MDFDPSAFLSMDMTEDGDAVYTAPDVPQGLSPVEVPAGKIVVEGGLQMEQDLQIPVPVFGLLQQDGSDGEEGESNTGDATRLDVPMHIDTTEHESNTTPQPSPGERTLSPCTKKIISTSLDETRFRKDLFSGSYERVKIFRLHCTICDRHLGCAPWFTERQMRMHKLLCVVVCRKCFEFYGDINFPIDEGSELYCCWCGEGGECFCCSTCPRIVCKKCVKRNFGPSKVKEIDENDDWSCFVCKPRDIWPHRALMWGLQRWSKNLRQLVAMLPKEEKQAKLSMDSSHCCLKDQDGVIFVGLPSKSILSKVPMNMIALPYRTGVQEVLASQETYSSMSNGVFPPNSQISYAPSMNPTQFQHQTPKPMVTQQQQHQIPRAVTQQQQHQISRAVTQQQKPQISRNPYQQPHQIPRAIVPQQPQHPRGIVGYHVRQVIRNDTVFMNRPTPYPMSRNMPPPILNNPPPSRVTYTPAPPQSDPRQSAYSGQTVPYRSYPPQRNEMTRTLFDTSELEHCIRDIKSFLQPTVTMLDQFDGIKNDLANDFTKLTSYAERLSYNIKIAICNLAKANTDLAENQKKFIDNKVSTVVRNIQSVVVSNTSSPSMNGTVRRSKDESSLTVSKPYMSIDSSPEIIEVNPNSPSKTPERNPSAADQITTSTPLSSSGEDVEDAAIAMFCETVLEVGENKENKDVANKDQATPVKRRPQQEINKPAKGKTSSTINRKRPRNQNESSDIQIIDLSDDEEENKKTKFDKSFWCKKFNIVPCKVVLEKLEIHKVDIV